MRRVHILALALSALCYGGCSDSSDELLEPNIQTEKTPINFMSHMPQLLSEDGTRASIITDGDEILSMGVYSYNVSDDTAEDETNYTLEDYIADPLLYLLNEDDNIMSNRLVERTNAGDEWTYTPVEYWNNSSEDHEGIYFLAYAPYSEGLVIIEGTDYDPYFEQEQGNGLSSYKLNHNVYINYHMPSKASMQPSLMVADPVVQCYDDTYKSGEQPAVKFSFNHAVASVGFKVDGNSRYKVLAAGIYGIYDIADLILGDDKNIWSNMTMQHDEDSRTWEQEYIYYGGLTDDTTPDDDAIVPKNITADDGYMMVIPQSMTSVAVLHVEYCEADYTPENYEPSESVSNIEYLENNANIKTMKYYLGSSRGWSAGYRYYYIITLPDSF